MSEGYRPRHNISRQFTEAELAVSDRTTDHLTQQVDQMPAPRLSRFGTADEAYGWLEKDLERRDQNTARLAREMDLAERQSLRKQLDVEANQDAERKASAADGVSYLSQWQEKGFGSMEEAKQAYLKENPSASMNPDFNAAYANLSRDFRTDQQRELEDITEKTNLAKSIIEYADVEHMQLDMEENPEKWEKMRDSLSDARMIGAEDAVEQAKFDVAIRAYGRKMATTNMHLWGMPDPGDGSLAMKQMEALDSAGLKVLDPGKLQSFFKAGSPQLQMVLDGTYLAKQDPELKSRIEESLNVLTDSKSDEDQVLEAQKLIESESFSYWKDTKVERESELRKQQVASALPAASKAAADALKANHSLLKGYKDEAIEADPSILVSEMASNARAALTQIKSELVSKNVPLEEYSAAVLKLEEISKKAQEKSALGYYGTITTEGNAANKTARDRINQAASFSQQITKITNDLLDSAMGAERKPVELEVTKTTTPSPKSKRAWTPADGAAAVKALGPSASRSAYDQWFIDNGIELPALPK